MSYLRDKKRNIKKMLLVGVLVILLVYIVLFTQVFNNISRWVGFTASPVWKVQESISSTWDNVATIFASKKALLEENKKLKDEAVIAGVKLLDRNLLFEENTDLKELLGRETVEQTVFAVVLTKPNRSAYDTIVIDVGENAGIKEGDKVLYGKSIAIGKIAEVFKNSSKVLLFSSPGEEVSVMVGRNSIETTAYGRGGGNFEIKLPRDAEVKIGDAVVAPSIMPSVLGVVGEIETESSSPIKNIFFKGPVDIFELKWVEVVVGK